nr:GNAT family protein [Nitratireductor luteus]
MIEDLSKWTARKAPARGVLEGRYVRLEPLDPLAHGDGLYEACHVADADQRFRWLFEEPPVSRDGFQLWLEKAAASADPLFFAVIDRASGKVGGRQALMRIDTVHGVAEIGSIYWGPDVARTRLATEAVYLSAQLLFGTLDYRRFEWKCNNQNEPSKRAAERFGFHYEGLFRQHMVVKGENRDTAWYAILDHEWPVLARAYEAWLSPENFDAEGRQLKPLAQFQKDMKSA